jgi:hypothetical protein
MRGGAAGRTVGIPAQEALMRRHRRAVASVLAAAFSLIVVPPAFGAAGVFGGSNADGDAIVLTTDAKAKKLRGAVIAWHASCTDDTYFALGSDVRPVVDEPGFTPGPDDLLVTRNAKGRFSGVQMSIWAMANSQTAIATVELSGRFRGARATGTLRATVSILDSTTAAEVMTCESGSLRWSASRAAGRIFGGKTSQDEPVVVRLDAKRKRVADLLVGWESSTCEPPGYMNIGDRLSGFPVRSRRFGGSFDETYPTDGGGKVVYAYDLAGTVSRKSIRGTLQVTVTGTDAAGATAMSCDSGSVSWSASTG